MGSGFAKKKKQAKQFQQQMKSMQEQLENTQVEGVAGGGLVTVSLGGDYSLKSVKIKPDCVDPEDIEGLEDLIVAAHQDAASKVKSNIQLPPMF